MKSLFSVCAEHPEIELAAYGMRPVEQRREPTLAERRAAFKKAQAARSLPAVDETANDK